MTNQKPLNEILNDKIAAKHPQVLNLLSRKGKEIFFPKGILFQGQQAKQYNAKIDATIGIALEDNDEPTPMFLNSIGNYIHGIDPNEVYRYASSYGLKGLRDKWKEKIIFKNSLLENASISTPVVTCALTHGLSMLGYLFIDPGTEIIVPDLYWGNYNLIFKKAYGAEFKTFAFFNEKDEFNLQSFKETFEQGGIGKKVLLLNFPNNPSGYTPTKQAVADLRDYLEEAAAAGNEILAMVDDAYFGLVYEREDIYRHSIFAELADLHENILAVKVDGITKEEFAWGLRVGFLTYGTKNGSPEMYDALEAKTAGALRGNISNVSLLSQSLALKAFFSEEYIEEKKVKFRLLKSRYLKVKEFLATNEDRYGKYFFPLPYNSGYFMCVHLKGIDAENVRMRLLKNYSTGVISVNPQLLRMAFSSTPTDKLEQLFENIYNACDDEFNGKES